MDERVQEQGAYQTQPSPTRSAVSRLRVSRPVTTGQEQGWEQEWWWRLCCTALAATLTAG